jgi:hypothetical protein
MVTTKADLSALTELAGQFGVISNNLSNLGQEISAPGAYGNGDLEGEVSSFVSDRTEQSIIGEANKDRAAISGGPNGSTR